MGVGHPRLPDFRKRPGSEFPGIRDSPAVHGACGISGDGRYFPMQKRHLSRMSLIFKEFMAVTKRAWTYSWTQIPSVSLGGGGWLSLYAPRALVAGAARQ